MARLRWLDGVYTIVVRCCLLHPIVYFSFFLRLTFAYNLLSESVAGGPPSGEGGALERFRGIGATVVARF